MLCSPSGQQRRVDELNTLAADTQQHGSLGTAAVAGPRTRSTGRQTSMQHVDSSDAVNNYVRPGCFRFFTGTNYSVMNASVL
jgi:hypothetical protein